MTQKIKGGMWCSQCQRPVLGVRNAHGARNGAAVGGAFFTGGLSLLALTAEPYVCGVCGSPVQVRRMPRAPLVPMAAPRETSPACSHFSWRMECKACRARRVAQDSGV